MLPLEGAGFDAAGADSVTTGAGEEAAVDEDEPAVLAAVFVDWAVDAVAGAGRSAGVPTGAGSEETVAPAPDTDARASGRAGVPEAGLLALPIRSAATKTPARTAMPPT